MSAAAIAVKGWCPGALQPMPSGDGLIVRIKPFCGALSLDQADGLAELADRLGNGNVDLTRRANLQIRGLAEADLPALHARLAELGLIDGDAEIEATRNLMVGPLAGLDESTVDVRALARAVSERLVSEPRLRLLSPKFGVLVDGGGPLSIAGERADLALLALDGDTVALGIDSREGTRWLGTTTIEAAPAVAIAAIHDFLDAAGGRGRMRSLPVETAMIALRQRVHAGSAPFQWRNHPSAREECATGVARSRQGRFGRVVGVAAPFGRLDAPELRGLVALAANAGAVDLRLSPWRSLYFAVRDQAAARSAIAGARSLGWIVDPSDPLLEIDACPGAPECESSSVETRRDARWLATLAAAHGFTGRIHVSGCAKGCARSEVSDLVLVGAAGSYGVARHATARDDMERRVAADSLADLFAERPRG